MKNKIITLVIVFFYIFLCSCEKEVKYSSGFGSNGPIALSFGLPVVTTEIGAEGFGLSPGQNILVAETSLDFAKSIMQLSQDKQLYKKLATNGYNFIKNNYSEETARVRLSKLINQTLLISPKRLEPLIRTKLWLQFTYNRYVGWRFQNG